jgi:hypothetical protein
MEKKKKKRKKGEFESPWNEFLKLKCGTPIMLEPLCTKATYKNINIGEVSNSLKQLALKIQSYELFARLKCFRLGLCVSKLKKILLSNKSSTTSVLNI